MHEWLQNAVTNLTEPGGAVDSAKLFIEGKFGTPGLIAAGLLLVSIAGLLISKTVKMSISILKFVVVPSIAISFIATYFLPFSFVYVLPVTVAFFSIVLIIKG